MEKLNELVELAKKATSGKWIADSGEGWNAIVSQQDMVNGNFIISEFIGPDSKANKDFVLAANPDNILAIAEAFRALEKRAEAAEAKLAVLGSMVPVYQYESGIYNEENGETDWYWDDCDKGFYEQYDVSRRRILFTRPGPAVSLAELVPGEYSAIRLQKARLWIDRILMDKPGMKEAKTVSAILRKIEEANK